MMKHSFKRKSGEFTLPMLILLTVCIFGRPSEAQTSIYIFDSDRSSVLKTGGFAGVHETYPIQGMFQLTVDANTGVASFDYVDAFLLSPVSSSPPEKLGELFNMTELTGIVLDNTKIIFVGKDSDDPGIDTIIIIIVYFTGDSVYLTGETIPPPNSADMFYYNLEAVAQRKYAGGTGEPNNPYQIATAENLILLGDTPEDYDKHFILTADIDLDPNLPGRKVFDRAVIAPDMNDLNWEFEGSPFNGVFDGNGYTISNLTITGSGYLGLFGYLEYGAEVKNLRVVDANIIGSGFSVGGLVGINGSKGGSGTVTHCYSSGVVSGNDYVGGLVGGNFGSMTKCYSTCAVNSKYNVGGLVGSNMGTVTHCYSSGPIIGTEWNVGGLVGSNLGSVNRCYSTGTVSGNSDVGGFVGYDSPMGVVNSVWDIQTSGQTGSAGGAGLTTAEMMDPYMLGLNGFANDPNWVLNAGHDYPRLVWQGTPGEVIPEPNIYWMEGAGTSEAPYQISTADQMILLGKASVLWDKHFVLRADIDLDPNLPGRRIFMQAVITAFAGVFDGNGYIISNLTINGKSYLGLFGRLGSGTVVKNLGVVDINITGSGNNIGAITGFNHYESSITLCYCNGIIKSSKDTIGGLIGMNNFGTITNSYFQGSVSGKSSVGGLVGSNVGTITNCSFNGEVFGAEFSIGGLVGVNATTSGIITDCNTLAVVSGNLKVGGFIGTNELGSIIDCYALGSVTADEEVGGFAGGNGGNITMCYTLCDVSGNKHVGGFSGQNGLTFYDICMTGTIYNCYSRGKIIGKVNVGGFVGYNFSLGGKIRYCYSTGEVLGTQKTGGLIGKNDYGGYNGEVINSFWDIETSGQTTSEGVEGKTTAEMQTESTFTDAGWDFAGETTNGTEDIWWIDEGQDYPRLWWELIEE